MPEGVAMTPDLPKDGEQIRAQIAEDRAQLQRAAQQREQHRRSMSRVQIALRRARRSLRHAAAAG